MMDKHFSYRWKMDRNPPFKSEVGAFMTDQLPQFLKHKLISEYHYSDFLMHF